jgi:hypothetical protein
MLDIIGVIIALLGTLYSSYTDIKTGEVSEKLVYSMIGIGVILVILDYSMSSAIWIFGLAALVFALGFALYIFGQIGGGDVFLFTALALLVPNYPAFLKPLMAQLGISPVTPIYPFIVPVFLMSGIFFMVVIPTIYLRKLFKQKKRIEDFRRKVLYGLIYCAVFLPLIYMWSRLSSLIAVLFIPMFFAFMIIPFKDDVVRLFFARKKKVSALNDDDVLALEVMSQGVIKKLGLWRKTFTKLELGKIKERAKKYKITTVMVCEDLPKYVPYIFASLVLNLIFGDVFFYLFQLG